MNDEDIWNEIDSWRYKFRKIEELQSQALIDPDGQVEIPVGLFPEEIVWIMNGEERGIYFLGSFTRNPSAVEMMDSFTALWYKFTIIRDEQGRFYIRSKNKDE